MRLLARVSAFLGFILLAGFASAQDYPSKPVRLLVPFPPGGSADLVARTISPKLSEFLGQQIIVDYRGGAGGSILIETGTFAGAGTITANGGNGGDYYGIRAGGAGGSIAVYCKNNSFGGTLSVAGGTTGGQHGTVAVFDNTNPEDLNFDVGHSWRFEPGDGPFVYNDMTMTGTEGNVSAIGIEADLTAQTINTEYATLTVSEGVVLTVDTLNIGNGTTINLGSTSVLNVTNFNVLGDFTYTGNLSINVDNMTVSAASTLSLIHI